MALGRYLSVNTGTKKILSGPYKWDPVISPEWTAPDGGTLITEAAATSGGYTPTIVTDNGETIRQKIPAAIAANNTFRAIPSPSNAQVVAYVQTVAKELNALLRLVGSMLDDASDT